jgi:hypothetical protein
MKGFSLLASCLMLAGCGDQAKPTTMTDHRLISELERCGIDPADAVQVNERVNGKPSDYLVFSHVAPYPEAKMRCLAHALLRTNYGVRRSGEKFESAYEAAWNLEFVIFKQELGMSWLRSHLPGKSAPQFVRGRFSLGGFARELEEFCGAKPGALLVERQSLRVPFPEDEPQADCLLMAALAANLEKHGLSVQTSSYE